MLLVRRSPWTWVAAAAGLAVGLAGPARAQEVEPPTFRVLVEDREEIANRDSEFVRVVLSRDTISLDREGNGFFDGATTDALLTQVAGSAVFVTDGETLRAVFVAGDAAPADGIDPGGSTIAFIDDDEVRYSPSGDVLAKVELTGGQRAGVALLTEFERRQEIAVAQGIAFRGICGVDFIGNGIATGQFAVNGDALVFHGALACGDRERVVVRDFGEVGGAASIAAIEGAPVPDVPGAEFDTLFSGAALNEDGAYVFAARYRDPEGSELIHLLLLLEPDGSVRVLETSGNPLDDDTFETTGFSTWTVGPGPSQSRPRVAYAVVADNGLEPADPGYRTAFAVLDTAIASTGAAGLAIETGETGQDAQDREFVFAATPLSFRRTIGLAIANDDTLVVVGETTGPDVPAGGEGVWRYDPDLGDAEPLKVVLTEGGPIPGDDPRAAGRTLTRLLTVNVNEQGRIAVECELSDGAQAILMEESGIENAGRFRIATRIGDTLPTRFGAGRLFGLLSELPSFPRVTGTGENGLQSRFNPRGEFIFRARIDPDDSEGSRTSLYTVSLDPTPTACDVQVRQRGANLDLEGDDGDCTITLRSLGQGGFEVVPGPQTTVNGDDQPIAVAGVTGNVRIRMGEGDDTLTLETVAPTAKAAGPFDVRRNLSIDTGDGADTLRVTNFRVLGGMTLRTGDFGSESVHVTTTFVGKAFKLSGEEQTLRLEIRDSRIEGTTKLSLPGRADEDESQTDVDFDNCALAKTVVSGSAFHDDVSFVDCDIVGALKIVTGDGEFEDVEIRDCTVRGSVRINAREAGLLCATIDSVEVTAGGIRCDASDRGCEVRITGGRVDRDLEFRTQGVPGSSDLNTIEVSGVDVRRFLILKGRGSHFFDVGGDTVVGRGIGINTRLGSDDQIELGSATVTRGNVTVKSRLAALTSALSGLVVRSGNVSVRGVGASDSVFVDDVQVSGTLLVALGDGDDTVRVNAATVGRDLRLFGGAGRDLLDNGTEAANTVARDTITDSFEGVPE